MNVLGFLIGQKLAEREGTDDSFRQTAGALLYAMGLKPASLLLVRTLSRKNAEARLQRLASEVPTTDRPAETPIPSPRTTDPTSTGTR